MSEAAQTVAALGGWTNGTFATLGGSNTLGACDVKPVRCNQTSFAALTFAALQRLGVVHYWANGGVGAMGPQMAAACTDKFAPVGARFATIEYLPNLGYTADDEGESAAIERLLHVLQRRGARVVFVNILPGGGMPRFAHCKEGEVGCTTRGHIEKVHASLQALATRYHVPTVTMDRDGAAFDLFNDDLMHLNQYGHQHVSDELVRLYTEWPHWQLGLSALNTTERERAASRAASLMPVTCHLGEELEPLVGISDGFARTNFARDPRSRADKIGWEARSAGASLTLCAPFPPKPPRLERQLLLPNTGHSQYRYVLALGMQLSHELNKPLFGLAHVACAGACRCLCKWSHHGAFNETCFYNGLAPGHSGASVTAFVRLLAARNESASPSAAAADGAAGSTAAAAEARAVSACPRETCVVTITNSPDPSEPRLRVLVRSLVFGHNDHHSSRWLNTHHLDGSGFTEWGRRLRAEP